jgi:iron(III) transport system ATP-binding protein
VTVNDHAAKREGATAAAVAPTRSAEPSSVVRVRSLAKYFRREDNTIVPAVDHVSLDVNKGEFVVLLGPSGCGKTTLLRCIGGLEKPDSGTIEVHGATVYDSDAALNVPPERRRISMIFQSYALWPHMSVFDNVAYPLRARGMQKELIAARVEEVLALVGIPGLVRQFPAQMSGGQQQRVALARAIAPKDELVLFDEPLSNVDAKVREALRIELLEMQLKLGFAAVYVTHDQTEAMALAHRVAVMRTGKVVQLASPREVYLRPSTRYVANFVGATNEITGRIAGEAGDRVRIETALGEMSVAATEAFAAGTEVALVFRPERCKLTATEPQGDARWQGVVEAALFLGPYTEHLVRVAGSIFRVWGDGEVFENGARVWLSVAPDDIRAVSDRSPAEG